MTTYFPILPLVVWAGIVDNVDSGPCRRRGKINSALARSIGEYVMQWNKETNSCFSSDVESSYLECKNYLFAMYPWARSYLSIESRDCT